MMMNGTLLVVVVLVWMVLTYGGIMRRSIGMLACACGIVVLLFLMRYSGLLFYE